MRREPVLLISLAVLLLILIYLYKGNVSLECQASDPNYCMKDDDCICSTNPCFFGNKEYYQKCFLPQQKEIVQACLDACGFGPYEWEFRTICENNRCRLTSFNRTTGERIK